MLQIDTRFAALQKLVLAANSKGLDEEVAAHLSRLGSVLVCGNLERCVEILVTERVGKKSAPQVSPFLRAYFKRGTNYDCDRIGALLYTLDNRWGKSFEEYIKSNEKIRESIASCYAVRNSVAHGGDNSLGPRTLKQYFDASFDLVAELESLIR